MRQFIYAILIIIVFEILSISCANPITPTGGPKDTIPPTLISSIPDTQQTNFKGEEIELTFDEFVNIDKIKQNLIITPFFDINYKQIVKKNRVILRFEEPFSDSTTYTFNFANGITDITERTPPDNLTLSFSTGNYIDSLKLIGKVTSLETGITPKNKFSVSLYLVTDSTNFVTQKPTYFSKINDTGQFEVKNIKFGEYILIAFNDENNNLQLDPASEAHALISDTITPVYLPDSTYLEYISLDASELKFISARPSAQYYEIRYSKPINSFQIDPFQYARIVSEQKVIRIYQDSSNLYDSLRVLVTASDTVLNETIDTLFIKFKESSRPIEEYKGTFKYKSASTNTRIIASFNKPTFKQDSTLKIKIDTIAEIKFPIDSIIINENNTKYIIESSFNKSDYNDILDSIIQLKFPDTIGIDSIGLAQFNFINRISRERFNLAIEKGTFISIQHDSLKTEIVDGKFFNPESYGSITVNTKTELTNYDVHIISSNQKSVASIKNCTTCSFTAIPPGEYSVRVYVDENNDGQWSPGNILTLTPAEPIINFQEFTDLRANWAIELNYQF